MDSVLDRLIQDVRRSVDRLEAHLRVGMGDRPASAPVPPAGREAEYFRWWSLLNDVATRGGRLPREEFHAVVRSYYDDLRGGNGYFSGEGKTLRYEDDIACLTEAGQAFVEQWEATFRPLKERGDRPEFVTSPSRPE